MQDTIKKEKQTKDHRFQIIGLDRVLRSKFLSVCKLNNRSGNEVLKAFMQEYIDKHDESQSWRTTT